MECLGVFLAFLCVSVSFASREFSKGNNLFTPAVYTQIAKTANTNFVVSPLSAEIILSLTLQGSKGQTAQELQTALHLPENATTIRSEIETLLPNLKSNDLYALHVANKIYIKENFTIENDFKKVAVEIFHSDSENINFEESNEAAQLMNNWVEQQTEKRIQNLISPKILDDRTRLILINAIYFKAKWARPFTTSSTQKIDFFKNSRDVIKVDAMHSPYGSFFLYYESVELDAKFLKIPFSGKDAAMVFVLPNERDGLELLENKSGRVFASYNFTSELVDAAIPKFRIESKFDLKNILKNLGVNAIFDDTKVDLSNIAGVKGQLVVSNVIQKSFLDVNEGGVEAAAASFVEIITESAFLEPPKQFKADHPFIFYIEVQGLIIFAGRVTDPTH